MKRVLVMAGLLCAIAVPALAADRPDFSAKAAGLDQMVQKQGRADVRREATSPAKTPAQQKKSFWKTPWPYVIGGGAIVAIVLIANKKEGGIY
jgi:hypothetical protein